MNSLLSLTRICILVVSPSRGRPSMATFCSSVRLGRLANASGSTDGSAIHQSQKNEFFSVLVCFVIALFATQHSSSTFFKEIFLNFFNSFPPVHHGGKNKSVKKKKKFFILFKFRTADLIESSIHSHLSRAKEKKI